MEEKYGLCMNVLEFGCLRHMVGVTHLNRMRNEVMSEGLEWKRSWHSEWTMECCLPTPRLDHLNCSIGRYYTTSLSISPLAAIAPHPSQFLHWLKLHHINLNSSIGCNCTTSLSFPPLAAIARHPSQFPNWLHCTTSLSIHPLATIAPHPYQFIH